MNTSFSTALSGLDAASTAIDVVGNNLANLNTNGFKTSQVCFADLVTQSLGAGLGDTQVGFGTDTPLTVRQFTQGSIQTSSGLLDAAIQGDGFFVVKDSAGNTLYTRAGSFKTDSDGNLLTATGEYVQGWTTINSATGKVDTNGAVGNIVVPVGSLNPPEATTGMTLDLNLNASSKADSTSDFTTAITVYDSLGTPHVLDASFEKTAENQWSYSITIPGDELSGGTAGSDYELAAGTLTFSSGGTLDSSNTSPVVIDIPGLTDGASDMQVSWDLFNAAGNGRITQYTQTSASSASSQDGSAAAELTEVGLADGGEILAKYSDGTQVVVGQLALANIRNASSLIAVGSNNYQLSADSAIPSIGVPGTGGRGDIVGGSLESSTVDIATEFTNLIVYQRYYQANSKVITTADGLSEDTINLIR
jgi:flagellar hook protein FlgE